jgi:hypothetical protein
MHYARLRAFLMSLSVQYRTSKLLFLLVFNVDLDLSFVIFLSFLQFTFSNLLCARSLQDTGFFKRLLTVSAARYPFQSCIGRFAGLDAYFVMLNKLNKSSCLLFFVLLSGNKIDFRT